MGPVWWVVAPKFCEVPDWPPILWWVVAPKFCEVPEVPSDHLWWVVVPKFCEVPEVPSAHLWWVVAPKVWEVQDATACMGATNQMVPTATAVAKTSKRLFIINPALGERQLPLSAFFENTVAVVTVSSAIGSATQAEPYQ